MSQILSFFSWSAIANYNSCPILSCKVSKQEHVSTQEQRADLHISKQPGLSDGDFFLDVLHCNDQILKYIEIYIYILKYYRHSS